MDRFDYEGLVVGQYVFYFEEKVNEYLKVQVISKDGPFVSLTNGEIKHMSQLFLELPSGDRSIYFWDI